MLRRRAPARAVALALACTVVVLLASGGTAILARGPSVAVHPSGGFVAAAVDGAVRPLSGTGSLLQATGNVRVGSAPELEAVNSTDGLVYVANSGSGNVSVLDGTALVGTVNVSTDGLGPREPIFDPAKPAIDLTYRSYLATHNVSYLYGPLTSGTQRVGEVAGVASQNEPVFGVYDPLKATLYLSDDGTYIGVDWVNPAAESLNASYITGPGSDPRAIGLDSADGWIYVVDLGTSALSVINGSASVGTVSIPSPANRTVLLNLSRGTFSPDYPADIAFDPADGEMYVADGGAGEVSVVSGARVVANVSVGKFPYAVTYDPASQDVFVTNVLSDNVSVLHGTSVVGSFNVGEFPIADAYDAAIGDVVVADLNSSTVMVLNATAVLEVVPVGTGPVDLLYDGVDLGLYVVNLVSGNVTVLAVPSSSGGGGHGLPPWEWGGLIALVLVILILVVVLALLRRRRRRAVPTAAAPSPAAGTEGATPPQSSRPG